MNDVVKFPSKEEEPVLVWFCAKCNCSSFYLYANDTVECAGCNNVSEQNGEWVKKLPPPDPETTKDNGAAVDTIAWGSADFSKRRVIKAAQDWKDDLGMIVVVKNDGAMRCWEGIETKAQKRWAIRQIKKWMTIVRGVSVDS